MSTKRVLTVVSVLVFGFAVALAAFSSRVTANIGSASYPSGYTFEGSYVAQTRDEMIAQAGAIIIGRVDSFTPTRWNQDSGDYWTERDKLTIPYHQVNVTVSQSLVDTIGLEKEVTITVLGPSPVTAGLPDDYVLESVQHTLQVGEEAMFFIVPREMGWRDGTRPILRLMGEPRLSYLKEKNGLYYSEDAEEPPLPLDSLVTKIKTITR